MYFCDSRGELVRKRRKEAGLTQAALADMVGCSDPWISNIENDKANLSWGLFSKLMGCLGEPGFPYSYYFEMGEMKFRETERLLIEFYENHLFEEFDRTLDEFEICCDKKNVRQSQMLRFMRLLQIKRSRRNRGHIGDFLEILKLTVKEFSIDGDFDNMVFGQTEVLLLNSISIELARIGDMEKAARIFLGIARMMGRCQYIVESTEKIKAAIYNNLAYCEALLGNWEKALEIIKRSLEHSCKAPGGLFYVKLKRTNIFLLRNHCGKESATEDIKAAKYRYEELPDYIKEKNDFNRLMSSTCFLRCF